MIQESSFFDCKAHYYSGWCESNGENEKFQVSSGWRILHNAALGAIVHVVNGATKSVPSSEEQGSDRYAASGRAALQ